MWLLRQPSFSKLNSQKGSLYPWRNQLIHLLQYGGPFGFHIGGNPIFIIVLNQ